MAATLGRRRVDASTIESWERGEAQPTPAQCRRLAEIFRIPEPWLFYPNPPTVDDLRIVDFRKHDGRTVDTVSLNLRSVIEHSLAVQAWVVDKRAGSDEQAVPLVGAKPDAESAKDVADYLRRALDVERLRREAKDAVAFFKGLRQRLEETGVLVLRMGQVGNKTRWSLDPNEFKGFALIDENRLAPLIFINRKDVDDAQLFTLGHELAHLVTGGSGISNEDIDDFDEHKPRIERFCDEVAEELLVPAEQFEQVWGAKRGLDEKQVNYVATELKVNPLVTGRRAVSLGRSTQKAFRAFVRASRERNAAKPSKGGGTVYQTYASWYGRELVRLLASAATTDYPSGSDVLDLLGLSYDVARKLAEQATGKRGKPKQLPRTEPVPSDLVALLVETGLTDDELQHLEEIIRSGERGVLVRAVAAVRQRKTTDAPVQTSAVDGDDPSIRLAVAHQLRHLLQTDTGMTVSEAAEKLLPRIKQHNTTVHSLARLQPRAKEGFDGWLFRLAQVVPPRLLLSEGTRLRNEIVQHTGDWSLIEDND